MTEPDFSREHRILHLASALQAGTATPEEVQEAADSLSYAAGERYGLEVQVETLERALAFYLRVMKIFHDLDLADALWWNFEGGVLQFSVMCSDFFDLAAADAEPLTPDNVAALEQAIADVEEKGRDESQLHWALLLFCARNRGQRPHAAVRIPDELKDLFAVEETA